MTSGLRLESIKPFPFIFCSKDFASSRNGATAVFFSAGNAIETSAFPASNLIDGNRGSFLEATKIGSATVNYASVHFDMSGSMLDVEDEINMICIQMDERFPAHKLRIISYTAANFSSNPLDHNISSDFYTGPFDPAIYARGSWPKIDGEDLFKRLPASAPHEVQGLDGRNVWILLDDAVTQDRPYVKIIFTTPGTNQFGVDGSWDNGLWSGSVDETIVTADPYPDSNGANDNQMKLVTTVSGPTQLSRTMSLSMRPSHEYVVRYATNSDTTVAGDGGLFKIEIAYFNNIGTQLGSTETLWSSVIASFAAWKLERWFINYKYKGTRVSGDNTFRHDVPSDTHTFTLRFVLIADDTDVLGWRVDDLTVYSLTTRTPINFIETFILNGASAETAIYVAYPITRDMSGTIRVHRVSMFQYKFSTSRKSGQLAELQDIGSKAGANPSSMQINQSGKVLMRDINGNIAGQFIPIAGIKSNKNIVFICPKEMKEAMNDLYASSVPFGMIEPQGDFSEYALKDGGLSWNAISPQSLSEEKDWLWQGNGTLVEI